MHTPATFSGRTGRPDRKILPLGTLFLIGFAFPVLSEPDPGFVGTQGLKTNRLGQSVRHLVSDPAFLEEKASLEALRSPEPLRPIEPVRTIRGLNDDGVVILQGGRSIALRGLVFNVSSELKARPEFSRFQKELVGKQARLLFERETHDVEGRLSPYVYLSDGALLNELFLKMGFARLDTRADLSPQYRRRLEKAEAFAGGSRSGSGTTPSPPGNHAPAKTFDSKLPQHRGSLLGVSARTSTVDREKRTGQNQPPRKHLLPGDGDQLPNPTGP